MDFLPRRSGEPEPKVFSSSGGAATSWTSSKPSARTSTGNYPSPKSGSPWYLRHLGEPVDRVAAAFPYGRVEVKVQPGGLRVPGGGARDNDFIVVVNAALFVRVP
jgi:hypothetical protein